MSAPTPWKLAAICGVGAAAGRALLSVDWTVFAGAFTVLQVGGDVGVDITIHHPV